MIRELVAQLLGQFEAVWPVEASRCPQDFAYLRHLVLFGLPGEQRPHREELCHDAAHREDVDRCIVVRGSEQYFGGSVPPRAHVVSERRPCIDLFRQTITPYSNWLATLKKSPVPGDFQYLPEVRNLHCLMVAE